MHCPFCFSKNIEIFKIDFPFIRHLDFEFIKQQSTIGNCLECDLGFNNILGSDKIDVDKIYKSKEYALSLRLNQLLYIKDFKDPVTPYFLQAEIINSYLNKTSLSVLDIGCYDGRLLKELDRRYTDADLNGYDVNSHIRHFFPKQKNFHFWCDNISNVKGSFDLICISHSLQYIFDINNFMNELFRLLKPGGTIFFQAPDISKNSYALLYGDLYYYFTPAIIKNIFNQHGFEINFIDHNNWFPREIVAFAKLVPGGKKNKYQNDKHLSSCCDYLYNVVSLLKNSFFKKPIGVLGTTLNAAFINNIIDDTIDFFVDENHTNVGKQFHGKKVIHPDMLDGSETILIPYGNSSKLIYDKLKKRIKNELICL